MTALNYLCDTYQFESDAVVQDVCDHEKGTALILDGTIFYPQGGGQPCDLGQIITDTAKFNVYDVRLNEQGEVLHFGEYEQGVLAVGEAVHLKIDQSRRLMCARLHSAGHLLDCAVEELGLDQLKPAKGYHFPQGPYVEYKGILENPFDHVQGIQTIIDHLLEKNLKMMICELSAEQAQAQGVWAPPGKSARTVAFEGYAACGCGGTHVESSLEIGKVVIRKISSKKGLTRIAYALENNDSSHQTNV